MTLTYKEKIIKAISLVKNLNELNYVEEKLKSTDQINRKTKQGRELTGELLTLTYKKARELIDNGELPF